MAQLQFMQQLEAYDNELEVRERIASGLYNAQHQAIAEEWLRRKEESRLAATSAKRDAREEETLSIARKALSNSNRANFIAISAIIFSVIVAAIIARYTVKYGN